MHPAVGHGASVPAESGTHPAESVQVLENIGENPSKKALYGALRSSGVPHDVACKALELKDNYAAKLKSEVKRKSLPVLVDERSARTAKATLMRLMQGKTVGPDMKEVKDSTALKAAEAVLDRQYPKVQKHVHMNLNFKFPERDLSRFRLDAVGNMDGNQGGAEVVE